MKKKLIIISIVLAVCILFLCNQPKHYNIKLENNIYKVNFKNNTLYSNYYFNYKKLIQEKIIDFKFYDVDGDLNDEILVITKCNDKINYGEYLVIYDTTLINKTIVTNEIYRQDFSSINPWKIDACNLDNDNDADIFIGVNKDTVFYKDVRNRPFFYSWDGEKLYKKWQGSFFTDWDLVDITFGDYFNYGHDLAAVLEKNKNEEYRIGLYNFTGFGFLNTTTSDIYKNVKSIKTIKEKNLDKIILTFNNSNKYKSIEMFPLRAIY